MSKAKNVKAGTVSVSNEQFIPLNRLKKSPSNARKTPHPQADIEALAASIAAHGMLQSPVVEPVSKRAALNAIADPLRLYRSGYLPHPG